MELAQVVYAFEPLLLYLVNVVFKSHGLQDSLMTGFVGCIFFIESFKYIANTQAVTANLVGIGRAYSLTCRTYLVLTLLGLVGSIKHTVGRHDEVSFLRDVQAFLQLVTAGLQSHCFFHKEVWRQYDTIADNVHLATLENTRWDAAKNIFLSFELQSVTSIRSTLEAGYHIILRGQHIDHLTFSFIAPLKTQQDINFSLIHLFMCYY